MKVAVFQGPVVFGDPEANLAASEAALAEADDRGTEILAMPETFLHGFFSPESFQADYAVDLAGTFFRSVLRRFEKYRCTLLLGLNERRGENVFNTVVSLSAAG